MNNSLAKLDCQSTGYIEALMADYLRDPSLVAPAWRRYFRETVQASPDEPPGERDSPLPPSRIFGPPGARDGNRSLRSKQPLGGTRIQDRVDQLVRAYRVRGHLAAQLDPLGLSRPEPEELGLARYGLADEDLDTRCSSLAIGGPNSQSLASLIARLKNTYCRYIGVQFMHIDDLGVRDWLAQRMEATENERELSRDAQLRILTRLTDAVIFEQFVRTKHVGAKTFSLEGAETLIPLLDLAIHKAILQGIDEIVMGMAHRGRLNVLANIIGKRPEEIFWEFADSHPQRFTGRGDVKYHLGYSGDWTTADGGRVHLSLCFNPSHLEFVNPVALGRMRAKQDRAGDDRRQRGLVLLLHGDASFAGEGIVQETLNLSQLAGYRTGGTLHIIVNNQIGFTTPSDQARSTTYASDVAKMLQIPIFHVNGEHPEAVAQVVDLALDFRARFCRDVVIDMYCYRRWGHNEADEPSFTQPLMYQAIAHRESIRDRYLEHLLHRGTGLQPVDVRPENASASQTCLTKPHGPGMLTRDEADAIARQRHELLETEFDRVQTGDFTPSSTTLAGIWQGYWGGPEPAEESVTAVSRDRLVQLLVQLTETPEAFHLHGKLKRSVDARRQMAAGKRPLDWSAAEALALATLAVEGHPIRLSGQDAARGTFSQRHAVLHDVVDGHTYCPLKHLAPDQARVEIINSPLCEAAALGFEYGYSLDFPEALVTWEAQFGDFWNASQVIVDQFIVSAEDKWQRLSGIVMLLPHGFEGQGPEHSSARLERFLNLAAEDNIQVVYPSTPAQYFHCLRRQVKRRWRKPLIVLTPKSLLRDPAVVSSLEDLSTGAFRHFLPDEVPDPERRIERVLLCSGKIYYELREAREQQNRMDMAILRVEQFYPLHEKSLHAMLRIYPREALVYWVQEEPENMGAWPYWRFRFGDRLFGRPLHHISRPASASPATGSKASHKREQEDVIQRALSDCQPTREGKP